MYIPLFTKFTSPHKKNPFHNVKYWSINHPPCQVYSVYLTRVYVPALRERPKEKNHEMCVSHYINCISPSWNPRSIPSFRNTRVISYISYISKKFLVCEMDIPDRVKRYTRKHYVRESKMA